MNLAAHEMRTRIAAAAGILMSLANPTSTSAAESKTYVMKLSTATINDVQHEWMKRFVAAVEKDSGGRIKGEIYPSSQLGRYRAKSKVRSSARSKGGSGRLNFWSGLTSVTRP